MERSGANPIEASELLMTAVHSDPEKRAAAIRSAKNWATAAFSLANHCSSVSAWLEQANGWSPVQEKQVDVVKRKLERQERCTAEVTERLCQISAQRHKLATDVGDLRTEISCLQKRCIALEDHAQEQEVPLMCF